MIYFRHSTLYFLGISDIFPVVRRFRPYIVVSFIFIVVYKRKRKSIIFWIDELDILILRARKIPIDSL